MVYLHQLILKKILYNKRIIFAQSKISLILFCDVSGFKAQPNHTPTI